VLFNDDKNIFLQKQVIEKGTLYQSFN
jgi:hypothetical protein